MSEVKGTLLGIILAIAVFTVVFAVMNVAIQSTSDTVAGRMNDSVNVEPEVVTDSRIGYTLTY